ncbi:MAG: hypothetical protein ACRDY0_05555 [Acidimicrobiales bacterium]
MTPTLVGRWQTRLLSVAVAGVLWTAVVTPFLPSGPTPPGASRIGDLYLLTMTAVGLVAGLGVVVWEPIYHLLMQFRWEKDWPPVFVILEAVPEGALVHWVLGHLVTSTGLGWPAFLVDFGTTWLVVFGFVHGPMRVPFIRWRFRGGRII